MDSWIEFIYLSSSHGSDGLLSLEQQVESVDLDVGFEESREEALCSSCMYRLVFFNNSVHSEFFWGVHLGYMCFNPFKKSVRKYVFCEQQDYRGNTKKKIKGPTPT
jgi:hypothetical protein